MGERKAMPWMCRSWPGAGSSRRSPSRSNRVLIGHPGLHAGQVHPEADMDAEPEADVLARPRGRCRTRPGRRTCARRGWPRRAAGHVGALLDGHAGQLGVRGRPAQDDGDRRLPAHGLLEGLRDRACGRPRTAAAGRGWSAGRRAGCPRRGRWSRPRPEEQPQEGVDLLVVEPAGRRPRPRPAR